MVEPRGLRPIGARWPRLVRAFAIAVAWPTMAAAQEPAPPCAECVVFAIAPGEPTPAASAVPVAVVFPANAPDAAPAAALSLVPRARAVAVILDARDAGVLS